MIVVLFFFSSRRRHTRFDCDWSSDVCSSDLGVLTIAVTDPQDLRTLDELELLIGREFRLVVSTRTAILESLNQSEGNSQVITRIQEEYRPVLIREDAQGEEVLSIEKIAKDQSPVVK